MIRNMRVLSSEPRKVFRLTSFLVATTSIRQRSRKQNLDYKVSKARHPSPAMPTLAAPKMMSLKRMSMATTVIWKEQQGILLGSLVLRLGMIWRI